VVIAAAAGIAGHVTVGSQATLAGRSGVTRDLPGGKTCFGFPAIPAAEEKRRIASVSRLPQLMARVKELERQLKGQQTCVRAAVAVDHAPRTATVRACLADSIFSMAWRCFTARTLLSFVHPS